MELVACKDLALVWFSSDVARAVVDVPYAQAVDAFEDLLDRLPRGRALTASARSGRAELRRAGGTNIVAIPGTRHHVGLVRPYLAAVETGTPEPVLVAVVAERDLAGPILGETLDAARAMARTFNERTGRKLNWRRFDLERGLYAPVAEGQPRARLSLESDLLRAISPGRRREETVIPTDVLTRTDEPTSDEPRRHRLEALSDPATDADA